jgi:hypothetical protein
MDWYEFDDKRFIKVGKWEEVTEKCSLAKYQPKLLFYEHTEFSRKVQENYLKIRSSPEEVRTRDANPSLLSHSPFSHQPPPPPLPSRDNLYANHKNTSASTSKGVSIPIKFISAAPNEKNQPETFVRRVQYPQSSPMNADSHPNYYPWSENNNNNNNTALKPIVRVPKKGT